MLRWLEKKYGKLRTTRRKVHEYLGMDLDFLTWGKVKVAMKQYIKEMLEDFPEVIDGEVSSPAADHLFQVQEAATKLSETDARTFHTYTAKLLFLYKRARHDIQTVVAFLTTQVKEPDEDDWKN
eukprot:5113247-Ditylum_brightwellii.AAC.1